MEQVSLNIIPRLPYSSANFIAHEGVAETERVLKAITLKTEFASAFIVGPERSGKTHLAVSMVEWLGRQGIDVRFVTGLDIPTLGYELDSKTETAPEVIIIDELQDYLLSVQPGGSGQFVSLFEWARRHNTKLILFSGVTIEELPCDDHVKSRLRSSLNLLIGSPSEHEVSAIIESMSKQRGFRLQPRNLEFLRRRLGRDISSLEKYLDRLIHLAQVLGRSIKRDLVSDAL